jgi:hypothetical protein
MVDLIVGTPTPPEVRKMLNEISQYYSNTPALRVPDDLLKYLTQDFVQVMEGWSK